MLTLSCSACTEPETVICTLRQCDTGMACSLCNSMCRWRGREVGGKWMYVVQGERNVWGRKGEGGWREMDVRERNV